MASRGGGYDGGRRGRGGGGRRGGGDFSRGGGRGGRGGGGGGGRGRGAGDERGGRGGGGGGRGRGAGDERFAPPPSFDLSTPKAPDRTGQGSSSSAGGMETLTRGAEALGIRDRAPEPRTEELAVAETAAPLTLAPSSAKAMRHPRRPGYGTVGRGCIVRANHFLVEVASRDLHHYDVSFSSNPSLSSSSSSSSSSSISC